MNHVSLHSSEAHAADPYSVFLCGQIEVRPPAGLLRPDWLWLHSWHRLQSEGASLSFVKYPGPVVASVPVHVFWINRVCVDLNRFGCWRWTVTQLFIPTVRCWRRSSPARLSKRWVSSCHGEFFPPRYFNRSHSELPIIKCDALMRHFTQLCGVNLYLTHVLDLSLEIFNKCRLRQRILPLANQREFALLYNEIYPPDLVPASRRSNAFNPKRNVKNKNTKLRSLKSGSSKRTPLESPEGAGKGRPRPTTSVLNKKGRMEIGASRHTLHSGSKVKGDAAE